MLFFVQVAYDLYFVAQYNTVLIFAQVASDLFVLHNTTPCLTPTPPFCGSGLLFILVTQYNTLVFVQVAYWLFVSRNTTPCYFASGFLVQISYLTNSENKNVKYKLVIYRKVSG